MKEFACIVCPRGCRLTAQLTEDGSVNVDGAGCCRGVQYAWDELTAPVRLVTSTVAIDGASIARLPVKSDRPVPKARVRDAVQALAFVRVKAPVMRGDVVASRVAGIDVNFIATRDLAAVARQSGLNSEQLEQQEPLA